MKGARRSGGASRVLRALAACGLLAADLAEAAADLPDPQNRVSFGRHGGDWSQGNCGSRTLQSPITINELYVPATGDFSYWYREVKDGSFNFYNDGRTLWADFAGQGVGFVSLPNAMAPRYELFRIDVHSPSEHTLRGEHLALELQLVHQPTSGPPGKQLVTVSILFNCSDPPHLKHMQQLYPGLLQQSGKLRASRKAATAAAIEERLAPDGELAAAQVGQRAAPTSSMPGYNKALQAFVRETPPIFQDWRSVAVTEAEPLNFGAWLQGGTFAMYRGSQTLPPCKENVVWLVRREPVLASNEQIETLFMRLLDTSDGFGNYRTVMPRNQRPVQFWTATELSFAPSPAPPPGVPSAAALRGWSEDAITIAKAASDYARDLSARMARAAVAQHEEYFKMPVGEPMPALGARTGVAVPAAPTLPPLEGPGGDVWAARQIGNYVKQAVGEAVAQDLKEVVPAATNLATGYVRRALLKAGGWPTTTTTTLLPPTLPGAAAGGVAAPPIPIVFTVMVLNVDYAMLTASPSTKALFVSTATGAVLAQLGGGLSSGDITLSLSPGSVIVTVTVQVPAGLDATGLQSTIAQKAGSIATSITGALANVPAILAVSPGGPPEVGDVGAPMMMPPVQAYAPAPAPAFAPGPAMPMPFEPAPMAFAPAPALADPNAPPLDPNAPKFDPNAGAAAPADPNAR